MPNPQRPNTGELLRRYRRAVGLTQEELGERAAVSARSISDIERSVSTAPHRGTLDGLADALELSLKDRDLLQASARAGRGLGKEDVNSPAVPDRSLLGALRLAGAFIRPGGRRFGNAVIRTYRAPALIRVVVVLALIALFVGFAFMVRTGTDSPTSISAARAFTPWHVTRVLPVNIGYAAGLAIDGNGNIFASTVGFYPRSGGVWKLAPSGQVLAHWGRYRGAAIYGNDVALDQHGNVFVVDLPHSEVLRISPTGRVVAAWGSSGSTPGNFVRPRAIAVDRHERVFVGDATGRIQKFTAMGKLLAVWPNCGVNRHDYCHPNYLATDIHGNLYVTDVATASVRKVSPVGKLMADWGTPGSDPTQFYTPAGVSLDVRGNVYVADLGNGRIHKFSSSGTPITWWGATSPGLFCPNSLAIDRRSSVYVGDCNQGSIQKYSASGIPFADWRPFRAVQVSSKSPSSMAIDRNGQVFVLTSDAALSMLTISPDGRLVRSWSSSALGPGQAHAPTGIAVDSAGNVYVADSATNRVLKLSRAGKVTGSFGTEGSGAGQLENPSAVTVDANGNVYVSDVGNRRVVKFSPSGTSLGVWNTAPDGTALFLQPQGITVDARGSVYVADRGKHAIEKFSPDGKLITQWGGADSNLLSEPVGIAVDVGGTVYVTDVGNNRVDAFSPDGRIVSEWGRLGLQAGEFNQPGAVSVDQHGTIYVTDSGNNRIQRLITR
jgi:tripartite motif-containing protein 71